MIRHQIFPLMLLLTVFGCAKSEMENLVVPGVVEIDKVRANESPVTTSFAITSHSRAVIELDEILSGCGFTVVDLPRKTIPAGESLDVPVKIDFSGRKGDFSTDLVVRPKMGEWHHIRITGSTAGKTQVKASHETISTEEVFVPSIGLNQMMILSFIKEM